jgi:hypothetical protein
MLPLLGSPLLGSGGGSLSLDTSSRLTAGPLQAGPVTVSVAGFGGRASASATVPQYATQTHIPASGGTELAGGNAALSSSTQRNLAILGAFALAALVIYKGR